METEDAIAATIEDLSHDGCGIADVAGRRIFVPGALPTEQVVVRTRRRRRKLREAELIEIVEPASDRVDPPCAYFGVCGGCALQHLDYRAQVRFKEKVVADAFRTIGSLEPDRWLMPVTGREWRYRRRARLGVKYVAGKGRVLVGFRERAASLITDMRHCPVLVPPMDESLGELADIIASTTVRDRIPQVEMAIGDDSGALVLRNLSPTARGDDDALRAFGESYGLDIYLQPGGPGSIAPLGDNPKRLTYSLDAFGLTYEFEPTDFIQVNAEVNASMVAIAIDAAELDAHDTVLDLYCGLGNFSLPIAQRVDRLLGVEVDAGLVARAARNAELNLVGNAQFITADLDQTDWSFFRQAWDVVFVDPARTGAAAAVGAMRCMAPRRVVYVSCHPGTLARDAAELRGQGYVLASVRVLDMFPHTHHVEVIAIFDRAD